MIVAISIFGLSILLGVLIWKLALSPGVRISTLQEWESRRFYVNIRSLELLLDSGEEAYLKRSLPPELFRQIQRKRILLARRFVERVGKNAVMLLQLAEKKGSSTETHAAARDFTNIALRVRLNAIIAGWSLCVRWIFPAAEIHIGSRCLDYKHLIDRNAALIISDAVVPARPRTRG